MDADDAALIEAISEGSNRAFNHLIDRHQGAVRTFLRGVAATPDEAEDLAQETFLTVWKRADSYSGGGTVRSWLFSIAYRKAMDQRRSWFRGRRRDTVFHDDGLDGRRAGVEEIIALQQALSVLPLDQRAAVMLCLGCGASHSEAAQALGAPLGTIKSHVLRGRERLREVFGVEP